MYSRSHSRFCVLEMCSISYAIVELYVSRRRGSTSASVLPGTFTLSTEAGIARIIAGVRLYADGSSDGSLGGSLPSGSSAAPRWP